MKTDIDKYIERRVEDYELIIRKFPGTTIAQVAELAISDLRQVGYIAKRGEW